MDEAPAVLANSKNNSCGKFGEADQPVVKAFKFARICSTTREQYLLAGGKMNVDGVQWMETTRILYQQA